MKTNSFILEKIVPQEAIDQLGHVNNVVYLQWVQDMAEKHWQTKAPKGIQKSVYWVVLNHNISYKNPAYLDDCLILKTWVDNFEGIKSKRHTEIIRKSDDQLIVKAETIWCLMDSEKQRPKRITPEIEVIFKRNNC